MASPIKVGLLLHFYQPWWQFPDVLSRIVDECYRPIFSWLSRRTRFSFSANVNWSLLELLRAHGHDDVIALIKDAADHGNIELFGTAAHHPILPLNTVEENERQIARDREGKATLGIPASTCGGFYLPEYAYSREVARPLVRAGFSYAVADDALFAAQHGYVPFDRVPKADGLSVFLRSRLWGNAMSQGRYDFDRFDREFTDAIGNWFGGGTGYVVLATDAETFGHHHKRLFDWLLKPMVENWERGESPVEILPFEGLHGTFARASGEMAVPPGSWSTENYDFVAGDHFPLWNSPKNIYHRALWRLVHAARQFGAEPAAHEDVLKALSSCCWWQVSGRPSFNPSLMMFGARKALEIIERCGDQRAKTEGRAAFGDLIRLPGINP